MDDGKLLEIKSQINIVDLVSSYTAISKAGKNYKGLCPFHNEKTPSFMVSSELQIFRCFGCGKSGDVFTFVQEIEGVDFPQSLKILADRAGIKIDIKEKNKEIKSRAEIISEINILSAEYYHFLLTKHDLGKKALSYLKEKRKLTDKTISEFKIGYAPNSWRSLSNFLISKKNFRLEDVVASSLIKQTDSKDRYFDLFRSRVVFPIRDWGGKIVGFTARALTNEEPKYLNISETELFHKGTLFFGIDKAKVQIKKENLAIIVEGQLDVISAHQAGFTNVIGTSGTAVTYDQFSKLSKLTKDVAFCFDNDSAGISASERAIELAELQNLNVRVVVIPKPYKDLDECVTKDPSAFEEAKKNPVSVYDFYFISALSQFDSANPIDKKKIAEFLSPKLAKIKDPILKDHYTSKLSELLQVSKESVISSLKRGVSLIEETPDARRLLTRGDSLKNLDPTALQEYALALIMRAPLDLAQNNLYKLGQKDFTDPSLESLFNELKAYLLGRKKEFQIKYFCAKLEKALSERVESIYLKDFGGDFEDPIKLSFELSAVVRRIKMLSAKRELKDLSVKIKNAEMLHDSKELQRLSILFKNVSERLGSYG